MDFIIEYSRYILPCLALIILLGCCSSLFSKRPKTKTVAFLVNAKSGESVALHYWETSIGRSSSCDIVLSYATVSRFHAVISRRKDSWIVYDTGSKTGILVNGEKIKGKSEICDGDSVIFGNAAYYFSAPNFSDGKDPAYVSALVSQSNGKVFLLEDSVCTVGRDKTNNIYLNLPTVSRSHAKLEFKDGKWNLENYSSNGVYINSKVVYDSRSLNDGDILDFGGAKIIFKEFYKQV
ncbi:MAG: FHA domain-containing protein [Clostridia bacterium]|nr:FHA domain-containing protein [Clostridia bacterium]